MPSATWRTLAIGSLRQADWLTAERARVYGGLLALTLAIVTAAFYARILAPALSGPGGLPLASDFDTFWAGARLALQGHAALAYDPASIRLAEGVAAAPEAGQLFVYLYPPVFLLLCLPLGLLPYLVALPVFLLGGAISTAAVIRRTLPPNWPWWPILAFPASLLNLVIGQNGFLSASCFGGAMLLLDRRPALAGACLGLLAFKPHLAIGVPVALVAARRWTALLACAATAAMLLLASWAVLGGAVWAAFLAAAPVARAMMNSAQVWPKMISVASAIRLLHGGAPLAYAGQALAALASLACVARVGARRPGAAAEIATLVSASLLCTPYIWDYDLVSLAIPLAWVARQAAWGFWRPWEKTTAAIAYLCPVLLRAGNIGAGVPLAPAIMGALLGVVVARSLSRMPERVAA